MNRLLCIFGITIFAAITLISAQQKNVTPESQTPLKDSLVSQATVQADSTDSQPGHANTVSPRNKATLKIVTEPKGASVVLDDSLKGESPAVFADIDTGIHSIVIRKKGYYLKKAQIQISSAMDHEFSFPLLQPGHILVRSTPPGATVTINGASAGVTPYEDNKLKPGDYTVQLSLQNYDSVERKISLSSGASDTLAVTMSFSQAYSDSVATTQASAQRQESRLTVGLVSGLFAAFALVLLITELLSE